MYILQCGGLPAGSANYIQNSSTQQAASNFNISGNGTIGGTLSVNMLSADTLNATTQYNLNGSRVLSIAGLSNTFAGVSAGTANTGASNSFFGRSAGAANTTGSSNAFFGAAAGGANTAGAANTTLGFNAYVGSGNLSFATAIGANATVSTSNTIVLGRSGGQEEVVIPGALFLGTLGSSSSTHICINAFTHLSSCSSSMRYKEQIQPFRAGLDLLERLRPVTFNWKVTGEHDLGLIAEEVAEVEPLLVTHNKKGEIEGVKYDQLNVVLVNAVREQQQLIDVQQRQLANQQNEIDALKRLICATHPRASLCKAARRAR